jgi:hypothetical protein
MELIAYCGLYCGACSFRLAATENDPMHLQSMPSSYDYLKGQPVELCPGCRLENKCGECAIRDCASGRELLHCGQCREFPCDRIIAFNNDGKPHHGEVLGNLQLLREIGERRWLEQMEAKWTCTCGAKRSWYYRSCGCPSRA